MNESSLRKGQIREFRGIHYVFVRQWLNGACVIPVVTSSEPQASTEFQTVTGKGTALVTQCWNVRNISAETVKQSKATDLGKIPPVEMDRMWRVVQHAVTGIRIPRRIAKDTGANPTNTAEFVSLAQHQHKAVQAADPLQEDMMKEFYG